jgi:polyhydroxybutyrate depolymerase
MWNVTGLVSIVTVAWLLSGFDVASLGADRQSSASGQAQTLVHDRITRRYVVRAPPDLAPRGRRVALVLVLHGGGGDAANAEKMTGFTEKARKEGFIVVYPEGTSRRGARLLMWNAGHCCGYAMDNRVKDVEFISALMDKLIEDYPVDLKRIYATGMSNGGMMAHRLGIELSHRLAAIAPVVATLFGDEKKPEQPVSAIMVNGMQDRSVPHQGGLPGGRFTGAWDGTPLKPVLEQAVFWANANGCSGSPDKVDDRAVTRWRHRCPAGRAVEIHLVKDNGHAWPGGEPGSARGDTPSSAFSGTDIIWQFFRAHAK